MAFQLVYLSQQDPKWKNDTLGFASNPKHTIGFVGCALTSVSMLLSGYGFPETPQSLNEKMKAKQGFADSGIRWNIVNQVHPQVTLKSNVPCEGTDAPLGQIDSWLAMGHPVVVRVDASPNPGLQWHYVLVYGREGDDYLMLDPWPYQPGTAKKDYLMKRYSQGMSLRRAIQQALFYEVAGATGPIVGPSSTTTPTGTSSPAGTPQPQPAPASTTDSGAYARVLDSVTWGLNIRSSRDMSSMANLVVAVPAGTQLLLLDPNDAAKVGQNSQWVHVREPGGKEGFAAAWYLERIGGTTSTPTTPAPSSTNEAPSSTPATTPASTPASTPSTSSTPATTPTPSPSTPDQPQKDKLTLVVSDAVGSSGLRLRQSPSMGGTLIKVLAAGTQLTVIEPVAKAKGKIGQANQWIYVREPNGNRGYVGAQFVKLA
jgi:hypothetical protein